jgi:hypothetical protein
VATIANALVDCTGVAGRACLNAAQVTIGAGPTYVITEWEAVLGGSGCQIADRARVHFEYRSNYRKEQFAGQPLIHLGSILFPSTAVCTLTIHRVYDDALERTLIFDGNRRPSMAFSVGSLGNYSMAFESVTPGVIGRLHHNMAHQAGLE